MIGIVDNISKFGLFVKINQQKGLLRWSSLKQAKNKVKYQKGDLISVEIAETREDGKIELDYLDINFRAKYNEFLSESQEKIELLSQKNKEMLGK